MAGLSSNAIQVGHPPSPREGGSFWPRVRISLR